MSWTPSSAQGMLTEMVCEVLIKTKDVRRLLAWRAIVVLIGRVVSWVVRVDERRLTTSNTLGDMMDVGRLNKII